MKSQDFFRENLTVEPINRRIFTRVRSTLLDFLIAALIANGLAFALVSWWTS